jgi:hypothetical protein
VAEDPQRRAEMVVRLAERHITCDSRNLTVHALMGTRGSYQTRPTPISGYGVGLAEQATKSMRPGAELGIADVLRSAGSGIRWSRAPSSRIRLDANAITDG